MAMVGCCSSRSADGRDVPIVVLMAGVGCCASRSADGRDVPVVVLMAGVDVVPVVDGRAGMLFSR